MSLLSATTRGGATGCRRVAVPVVLMHMRGTPADMYAQAHYADVAAEVTRELGQRIAAAERAGIARDRIAIDPGIGFAKTAEQSLELLRRLPQLRALGCPILVGVSRKSFLGAAGGEQDARRRLPVRWPPVCSRCRTAPRSCACTTSRKPCRR